MMISYPLLATRESTARAIAASGVSEVEHEASQARPERAAAWRTPVDAPVYPRGSGGCPDCGGPVYRASGCLLCPGCGWGRCG